MRAAAAAAPPGSIGRYDGSVANALIERTEAR